MKQPPLLEADTETFLVLTPQAGWVTCDLPLLSLLFLQCCPDAVCVHLSTIDFLFLSCALWFMCMLSDLVFGGRAWSLAAWQKRQEHRRICFLSDLACFMHSVPCKSFT